MDSQSEITERTYSTLTNNISMLSQSTSSSSNVEMRNKGADSVLQTKTGSSEFTRQSRQRHTSLTWARRSKMPRSMSAPSSLRRTFSWRGSVRVSRVMKQYKIRNRSHIDNLTQVLSGLYAMLLVVMGASLPISRVFARDISQEILEGFHIYLFLVSIAFMVYVHVFVLCANNNNSMTSERSSKHSCCFRSKPTTLPCSSIDTKPTAEDVDTSFLHSTPVTINVHRGDKNEGGVNNRWYSFADSSRSGAGYYLRLGVIVFGLCTVVHNVLEFGMFMELQTRACADTTSIHAVRPILQLVFTSMQLYFIFIHSKLCIHRWRPLAHLGSMHMVATNLCTWLRFITTETAREIDKVLSLFSLAESASDVHHSLPHDSNNLTHPAENNSWTSAVSQVHSHRRRDIHDYDVNVKRLSEMTTHISFMTSSCDEPSFTEQLVETCSQYLYPCAIEYCLLAAAILVVMWNNVERSVPSPDEHGVTHGRDSEKTVNKQRSKTETSTGKLQSLRNHLTLDCSGAMRGLFAGLFVLVLTVISIVVFFVFLGSASIPSGGAKSGEQNSHSHHAVVPAAGDTSGQHNGGHGLDTSGEHKGHISETGTHSAKEGLQDVFQNAFTTSHVTLIILYFMASVAVCLAAHYFKELDFVNKRKRRLDEILLVLSMIGVYLLRLFNTIAGYYAKDQSVGLLIVTTNILIIFEATIQTVFLLNALHRLPRSPSQQDLKPGRDYIAFLLICNVSMWALNSFEVLRSETNSIALTFYGPVTWCMLAHIATPLTIFHQFHATVCLSTIWKTAYKYKAKLS